MSARSLALEQSPRPVAEDEEYAEHVRLVEELLLRDPADTQLGRPLLREMLAPRNDVHPERAGSRDHLPAKVAEPGQTERQSAQRDREPRLPATCPDRPVLDADALGGGEG